MDLAGHVQVQRTSGLEASPPISQSCAKVRRISAHNFAALLMLWDVIVLTLSGIAPALFYDHVGAAAPGRLLVVATPTRTDGTHRRSDRMTPCAS